MPAEADAAPVKLMASRIIARNISSFSPPCLYVARRRRLTSTIVYSRLAASTSDGERLVATKQAHKKAGGDRHPRGAHSFQVQRVWRIRHPRAKRGPATTESAAPARSESPASPQEYGIPDGRR